MRLVRIEKALLALFDAEAIGPDTLVDVAQRLSKTGVSRVAIMDFYFHIMSRQGSKLSQEQLDMLGDVNLHLSGQQCPIDQVIRLEGDPVDPLDLYDRVREQMKGWVPPSANDRKRD